MSLEDAIRSSANADLGFLRVSLNDDGSIKSSALGGSLSATAQPGTTLSIDATTGDIVFTTNSVERGRIKNDGYLTGAFAPSDPRLLKVIDLFTPLNADFGIQMHANGTDYTLFYGFGGTRYWRTTLIQENWNPGSYTLHQLHSSSDGMPLTKVLGSDASVTRGAGVTQTSQAASYGGQYWYGTAAAQTFTIAVPASTRIGIRAPNAANGGLAIVSIDGDKTLANVLPTAQSMVTSGAYPNTILVANGGTCNPTDRVLDCYFSAFFPTNGYAYDLTATIADNLANTTHTVVLTPVGVARTVGGGTRVYFSGYGYGTTATLPTTAGAYFFDTYPLNSNQDSAWEYAIQSNFVGHGGDTFMGNFHGYDSEDSLTIVADGVTQAAMTANQVVAPVSYLEITRRSHLVSPADSSTLANIVTVYRLDANGLRVTVTITWLQTITLDAAYVMCPMNGVGYTKYGNGPDIIFNEFNQLGLAGGPYTLPGTSDTYYGNIQTQATWTYGGNYGALMWQPDPNLWTNAWAKSGGTGTLGKYWSVEDRSGGSSSYYTKQYLARIFNAGGQSETVGNGTVWQSQTNYLIGRFSGGASAALGG